MNVLKLVEFDKTLFVKFLYFLKHDYSQQNASLDYVSKFFESIYMDFTNESELKRIMTLIGWITPHWNYYLSKRVCNQHLFNLMIEDLISSPINSIVYDFEELNLENVSLCQIYTSTCNKMICHLMLSCVNDFPEYLEYKKSLESSNET